MLVLDVDHQIGLWAGAAEEHLARIGGIQRLEGIVDFAFHKLVLASVTDAGAAAKVRKDALIFGKFEQVLIPYSFCIYLPERPAKDVPCMVFNGPNLIDRNPYCKHYYFQIQYGGKDNLRFDLGYLAGN